MWLSSQRSFSISAEGSYRGRAGAMLRDIIIWLALGLGVVMLYIYKDNLVIAVRALRSLGAHASQP